MLADCRSALMAVFVVDEAPLLPRSSVATTAQQQKGKASALTVVDDMHMLVHVQLSHETQWVLSCQLHLGLRLGTSPKACSGS